MKQEVLDMQKPLKVNIYVCMKDKTVPYNTLSSDEKMELGIRLNRRGLQAAARVEGYELEFFDLPKADIGIE